MTFAGLNHLTSALDAIREAGFSGVEFAQRPDALPVRDVDHLLALLRSRELELLSFDAGTIRERIAFLSEFRPPYLYVDRWEPHGVNVALRKGFTVAVHPRVFGPIPRLSDALALLNRKPEVKLLLDTAHLLISGDHPVRAVDEHANRIAAVHLKDWAPEYGRSSLGFARGFTNLGQGVVPLRDVIDALDSSVFRGWAIVELDIPNQDPVSVAFNSARWLARHISFPEPPPPKTVALPVRPNVPESVPGIDKFLDAVLSATTADPSQFYDALAAATRGLIPSHMVSIWTCSAAQDHMGLRSVSPGSAKLRDHRHPLHTTLSGIAVDRQAPATTFDLTRKHPAATFGHPSRRFQDPNLLRSMGLGKMFSVPVFNIGNYNFVRLIVNIFPKDTAPSLVPSFFHWYGAVVAIALDSMLERYATLSASSISWLASCNLGQTSFLRALVDEVSRRLRAEGVALFLANSTHDKLELAETLHTEWRVPSAYQFYKLGEGLTGTCWERKQILITPHSRSENRYSGKSSDITRSRDHAAIWYPLLDPEGTGIGVIRCSNVHRRPTTRVSSTLFSEDDAAVLGTIAEAAIPHLLLVQSRAKRASVFRRLFHEVSKPIIGVRAAAEAIGRRPEESIGRADGDLTVLRNVDDIIAWTDVLTNLLNTAGVIDFEDLVPHLEVAPTRLYDDIIGPSLRLTTMLLRERDFSPVSITSSTFKAFPPLLLDARLFIQVIVNLISNAIKHAWSAPSRFKVSIGGHCSERGIRIWLRDWGPGIPPGLEEVIFTEGFRAARAIRYAPSGQGIGLWVARRIVEAHGGTLQVTHHREPTQFTISLPIKVAPRQRRERAE